MVGGGSRDSQFIDTGNYEETSNRASWNEFQKAHLVELLVEFHQPGARKQVGWSSVAWNEITRRFNTKFSNTNFSLKQIKEQEHTLKKQYKTIQRLRNQPGFGWDIFTNMVTAPEDVWVPLLKDKEIKRWYNKPFPYYDALHKVYCGFIVTGKCKRGSNYFTNNEVEFEQTIPTIHAPREQPHFDVEENSSISTQPNLNFAQEPSPIHQSISASRREETELICASIQNNSDGTAIHSEEFSVSAAVKTFQQLQGFSNGDTVFAITLFINNARVCEAFLSCNEETRAPLIKAIIDQHKPKQKRQWEELEQDANQNQSGSKLVRVIDQYNAKQRRRPREELEQDANQNQSQSKLERVISSMENGQKQPREDLEQDANQNQSQSKLVRVNSSMENGWKRPWEELEQDTNQNQPESKLVLVISSMENGWKRRWEELEQDANQNQSQSKLVQVISLMENGRKRQWEELEQDANQNPESKLVRVISSMEHGGKRLWEELEQDANQNQSQSKLVQVISSMENGRKRQWEELEQDANQNQSQSKLVRVISSMENDLKRQWEELEQDANQNPESKLVRVISPMENGGNRLREELEQYANQNQSQLKLVQVISSMENGRKRQWVELEQDSNQNQSQSKLVRLISSIENDLKRLREELEQDANQNQSQSKLVRVISLMENGRKRLREELEQDANQNQPQWSLMRTTSPSFYFNCQNRQYYIEEAVPALRTQPLRIEELLTHKLIFANQVPQTIYTGEKITDVFEKHYPPMLNDDVWRLESIVKNGKYHQKLKDKNINSVQDLLKLLNANPNGLNEILKMQTNVFEKIVKHANMCPMELDNAKFENNADLPSVVQLSFTDCDSSDCSHMTEIPGLKPNPMPEFQPNMVNHTVQGKSLEIR